MGVHIVTGPGYILDGKGGIVLLGEWSRNLTLECHGCGETQDIRLCADEIISDDECDEHLNAHLPRLGWSTSAAGDACPTCTREGL